MQVPLPNGSSIIKVQYIYNTPVFAILLKKSLVIYERYSLLPIAVHSRDSTSLEKHGSNEDVKCMQKLVDKIPLKQNSVTNLFVKTNSDFLIIYQLHINYSSSLYEVRIEGSEDPLQQGLPFVSTQKASFFDVLKNSALRLANGMSECYEMENVEHWSNRATDDKIGNYKIPGAKLLIARMLKVTNGILKYWLKNNSHNLIVFGKVDNNDECLQIINTSNFKNQTIFFSDLSWYHNNSKINEIEFCQSRNYFIFSNEMKEIWYMSLEQGEHEVMTQGYKIGELESCPGGHKFYFSNIFDLVSIRLESRFAIYKIGNNSGKLSLKSLKNFRNEASGRMEITWSYCGNFFILHDKETGFWSINTKFGDRTFDSFKMSSERISHDETAVDFLCISDFMLYPSSNFILLMNKNRDQLMLLSLKHVCFGSLAELKSDRLFFYNDEYISLINAAVRKFGQFLKYPAPPKFRRIMRNLDYTSEAAKYNSTSIGNICLSINKYYQLSFSYGNDIAISTPFSDGTTVRQILWLNFNNLYLEDFNLVGHMWFEDYLLLINRYTRDDNIPADELIILDTLETRFIYGGCQIKFDSDLILWRYSFESTIVTYATNDHKYESSMGELTAKCNISFLTNDAKIIVFTLQKNESKGSVTLPKTSVAYQSDNTGRSPDDHMVFVQWNRSIELKTIASEIEISKVSQLAFFSNHFLFLSNDGDIFFLQDQSDDIERKQSSDEGGKKAKVYRLVKILSAVERFQLSNMARGEADMLCLILYRGDNFDIIDLNEIVEQKVFSGHDFSEYHNGKELDFFLLTVKLDTNPLCFVADSLLERSGTLSVRMLTLETTYNYINQCSILDSLISTHNLLHNFIETEISRSTDTNLIFKQFFDFEHFQYCLEYMLSIYLAENAESLTRLIDLIQKIERPEYIYVNCLRKLDRTYWSRLFTLLKKSPEGLLRDLMEMDYVDLSYIYLIVYLSSKNHNSSSSSLSSTDVEIIIEIGKKLIKEEKWDSCFDLCRFIKALQPSNDLLMKIRSLCE